MKNNKLVPKDKEDLEFINELKSKSIVEIKDIVPELLEWTQDMNWPQTRLLVDYFSPYINEIDIHIIEILKGNDSIWKYSVLLGLISNSNVIPNNKILGVINEIYKNPSKDDKEEEIDVLAQEIIEKYHYSTDL